jgi:two-component system nitrate/nitrite response regulator NarL
LIRTAITSDVRLYREGLGEMLRRHADIEVVGMADNAQASAELVEHTHIDVHLVDSSTTDVLLAIRAVTTRDASVRTIIMGIVEREREIVEYAEAGVAGYVTRDDSGDRLVEIIRSVVGGESPCSARLTAALLRRLAILAADRETSVPEAALTARERQIVQLIDEGLSNKQIAQRLQIELPTVKNHVHRILAKLGVTGRAQAAARFRRWQLLGL